MYKHYRLKKVIKRSLEIAFIILLREAGSQAYCSRLTNVLSGFPVERTQSRFTSFHLSFGLVYLIFLTLFS